MTTSEESKVKKPFFDGIWVDDTILNRILSACLEIAPRRGHQSTFEWVTSRLKASAASKQYGYKGLECWYGKQLNAPTIFPTTLKNVEKPNPDSLRQTTSVAFALFSKPLQHPSFTIWCVHIYLRVFTRQVVWNFHVDSLVHLHEGKCHL